MLQVCRNANFREEALNAKHSAKLRMQHLECDRTVMAEVMRAIHCRHASAADLSFNAIATVERVRQRFGE